VVTPASHDEVEEYQQATEHVSGWRGGRPRSGVVHEQSAANDRGCCRIPGRFLERVLQLGTFCS
jgi:hypothetical protein